MKIMYTVVISLFFSSILHANINTSNLIPHYLYQFSNHIKKKNNNYKYHIHIISSNSKLKSIFKSVLDRERVDEKKILVTQSKDLSIPENTNMIYLGVDSNNLFEKLNTQINAKSILLISFEQHNKKNVMINLFITKKHTLNFEINRANILNEGFSISDKVVLMGGTELDVAKLFKGAKQSLNKKELELQKKNSELQQKKIELQKSKTKLLKINTKAKKLIKQAKELEARNKLTTSKLISVKKEVNKLLQDIKKAQELYDKQKLNNIELEKKIINNSKKNNVIQKDTSKLLILIDKKNSDLLKREETLKLLNEKILDKEKDLERLSNVTISQNKKITSQEDQIDTQQNFLILMIITLVLFVLLVISIVVMLKQQRKTSTKLKVTLDELEEMQEELVQSAKMASLGELVAGLSHEMNTPIGVSITGVSILKNEQKNIQEKLDKQTLKESDLLAHINTLDDVTSSLEVSLQKAAQLVRSFKQVSVDQQTEVQREFNLNEYLNTVLISFKSHFKHSNINMHFEIDNSIVLNSYPGIYYQIFTNLVNNSILHAFENTQNKNIWISAKIENNYLDLVYKDDGKGVLNDDLYHIFEPFFTTKRANGGTGLGLHIIYNLITQKLDGSIKAKSVQGDGLTMHMRLPLNLR